MAAIAFFVLALACESFAYWGLYTVAGRHAFDEMAGMLPLGAGVVGLLFALAAVIAWWRGKRARGRRST